MAMLSPKPQNGAPDAILVVSASARALASSCLRAGLSPYALDLYNDRDLTARCPAGRLDPDDFSGSTLTALEGLPTLPVIVGGGLENRPDVLERITVRQRLLGSTPEAVRRVRDPFALRDLLAARGLQTPCVRPWSSPPPLDEGDWLVKPLRSAGGGGIHAFRHGDVRRDCYFQRRVTGVPASAVFVAGAGVVDGVKLLGTTRQLVGESWLNAPEFSYCGSVLPIALEEAALEQLRAAGQTIAASFDLRGLFGVDFLVDGDAAVFLEVNPRYTASVETLERALDLSAIRLHLDACEGRRVELPAAADPLSSAKAILWARDERRFSYPDDTTLNTLAGLGVELADVPREGELISAGSPVLTVLRDAPRGSDPEQGLRDAVELLDQGAQDP